MALRISKRWSALATASALFALGGCSKSDASTAKPAAAPAPEAAPAAAPLAVGVLIPGSKSDKGWMESGYDGMKRAESRHAAKLEVEYVENVKFADMEQALTMLATKSALVIGVGGQT